MSSNAAAVSPDTAQNPEPHKPQSLYQKKRHTSDIVLRIVIYTATAITVAALIGIIGYILWNGIPHITWSFLSSPYSETRASMNMCIRDRNISNKESCNIIVLKDG